MQIDQEQRDRILRRWWIAMSIAGITTALVSCVGAYMYPDCRPLKVLSAIIWTFGPPLWFMLEYWWLFPKYGNVAHKADMKYGQGLATKFWAGVGALLAVIYQVV